MDRLYESNLRNRQARNFFTYSNCEGRLNAFERLKLNEAYEKFIRLESLMTESYRPTGNERIQAWHKFIVMEDKATPGKGYLLQEFVKKAFKAISKAVAGKRSLEKGGSLFGLGKKSKAQRAEFEKMKNETQKEFMDAIEGSVTEDYPNNDDVEEFKKETQDVLDNADKFIKNSPVEARPELYKALKKWVTYQLDQNMGDHYKHFMETKRFRLPRLDEERKKKEEKSALEDSETIKGLESDTFPKFLKMLGIAGLGSMVGILASHPEIFSSDTVKAIITNDAQTVQQAVEKAMPPVTLRSRFCDELFPEFFKKIGDAKPDKSPQEMLEFFKTMGGGDESAGAKAIFDKMGIANPGGENSEYVLGRLEKGMSVKDSFGMPGSTTGRMERFGGAAGTPVSISGLVTKVLVSKVIRTSVTQLVGVSAAGAGGAVAGAAAAGVVGVGALLSGWAIGRLRKKSLKDSRAAFLKDLYGKIDELQKDPPAEPPPADPPSTEPAPSVTSPDATPGGEEGEKREGPKCDPDTIKQKILDFIKTRKGIKETQHQIIVNNLAKAVTVPDFKPVDVADLEKIIPTVRGLKKLKPQTVSGLANAIKDCFDLEEDVEEEEGAPEPGTGGEEAPAEPEKEVKKIEAGTQEDIATRAFDDQASYFEPEKPGFEKDQKYSAFVRNANTENSTDESNAIAAGNYKRTYQEKLSKADFRKLVRLLSDMGKLDDNEINFEDEEIRNDLSTTTNKQFKKSLPGQYMARARKLSNDPQVQDLLRDNDLPLMLLAKRRALAEAIALILRRSAQVLTEQRRLRSDKIVLERWQRMAGLLKG